MGYEIGQVVQMGQGRPGVLAEAGSARWYALVTRPQREDRALVWLGRQGVTCWYPTVQRYRRHGRRRVAVAQRLAPGYLFARFQGEPRWDVLFDGEPGGRYLRGVVGRGGFAVPIPDAAMAEVRGLPQRLLESEAEMLERARRAARIEPGCRVRVVAGALEGWVVEVSAVHAGVARLVVPLLASEREVSCPVMDLARIDRA